MYVSQKNNDDNFNQEISYKESDLLLVNSQGIQKIN